MLVGIYKILGIVLSMENFMIDILKIMIDILKFKIVEIKLLVIELYKYYGEYEVLKGVLFLVKVGDVIFIIGLFGLGKSIFLCCINFLEKFSEGLISVNN